MRHSAIFLHKFFFFGLPCFREMVTISSSSIVSNQSPSLADTPEQSSIHSRNVAEIHMVPFGVITRPIPPVLDVSYSHCFGVA